MSDEYLEAEIQHLLTENADIAEQGITASRRDNTLVLCGEVESPQRRDEILRLVQERYPDLRLASDIGVTRAAAPTEAEELP
ncbi:MULTISPECIES: hypothetical protein [Polymorphospora]|uniref:BON domain-containing protein n=1 Tax=Polymorphospora lycopeni TaxID=3140240 RepID=A0ABV5CNQ3_9ACTN